MHRISDLKLSGQKNCPHDFPTYFNHISVDFLHIPTIQIFLESQDSGLLDTLPHLALILNNWLVI
jgi:hypothetical protein